MNDEVIAAAERILADREIFEHGCGECCVLAQIDSDGFPTAATISPAKIDGIKHIYFCSGIDSNWAKRTESSNRACVCFNSEDKQYNITLVGTMEVLTDLPTKTEMWFDGMGYYYKGPEDEQFCVLKFTTQRYSLMLNEHDTSNNARGAL